MVVSQNRGTLNVDLNIPQTPNTLNPKTYYDPYYSKKEIREALAKRVQELTGGLMVGF